MFVSITTVEDSDVEVVVNHSLAQGYAKAFKELSDTYGVDNDLTSFKGKDDVLTLLIHLGYLSYNSDTQTVHIPNEEIRIEFERSIHEVTHEAT